jgi:glycosyltransferase involved in cell wall biosynthesis
MHHMQAILSLVWFKVYPPRFGGQKGIALFNKHLAEHYETDCLCSNDNEVLKNFGCTVLPQLTRGKRQFLNPANWVRIWQQLQQKDYTYLIVEFPYYGLPALLLKPKRTKLIVHAHNIEAFRFRSLGKKGWKALYYYERLVYQNADVVLFKTEAERILSQAAFKLKTQQTYVLPYGIEPAGNFDKTAAQAEVRERHEIKTAEKILLFAGTLDYGPNAEAVTLLYQKIEPLLRQQLTAYKILICGRNDFPEYGYLKKLENSNIIYAGLVENMDTYFAAADVFINPVQNVHGVQTKLFDALNYHLNVVSFSNAAKGLPDYLLPKVFITPENNYEAFAHNTVLALKPTFATPEAFYNDFSWKTIAARFATYLNEYAASA